MDNGKLSFKGEYLNGKEWIGTGFDRFDYVRYKLSNNINGKGKEYWDNGDLRFEGEYLNGKRNGKGKEYYKNGKLSFEGEYKNDLKWDGNGYDSNNNIAYELKDGKGLIKEFDKFDKLKF